MVSLIYNDCSTYLYLCVQGDRGPLGFSLTLKKQSVLLQKRKLHGLKYLDGFEKLSADILNILKNKTKIISFRHSGAGADRDIFIISVWAEKLEKELRAT